MPITTTYSCDKCGMNHPDGKDLLTISVGVSTISIAGKVGHYLPPTKIVGIWCKSCAAIAGLTGPEPKPEDPPVLTLDEIVREIVQEEIDNAQS